MQDNTRKCEPPQDKKLLVHSSFLFAPADYMRYVELFCHCYICSFCGQTNGNRMTAMRDGNFTTNAKK